MMKFRLFALGLLLGIAVLGPSLAAQRIAADSRQNPNANDKDTDSAEMKAMFEEDQRVRRADVPDWEASDRERRRRTHALLDSGALHTGKDYEWASFIFQHGDTPNDFLLAHALAMTAVSKGDGHANWIAAATLDRYLLHVGRPQVFGTQYQKVGTIRADGSWTDGIPPNAAWTQAPYDRKLIADAVRSALDVPPIDVQRKQLESLQSESAR